MKSKHLKRRLALAVAAAVAGPAVGHGMTINLTYTSNVTSLIQAKAFESAINYAAQQYDEMFTNPITLNITVNTANLGSNILGKSFSNSPFGTSYSAIRSALTSNATSSAQLTDVADNWPATDPTGTNSDWYIPTAEAKALGMNFTYPSGDGTFAFNNSNTTWALDPYNRTVSGDYDIIGTAEHEFSELMGRVGSQGALDTINKPAYEPFDLNHYTAPGVRDLGGRAGGDYFSIDGGNTNLKAFNSGATGDLTDWQNTVSNTNSTYVPDSYNAFSNLAITNALTPVDATTMNILGYNLASTALTFKGGTNDFLTGGNWESSNSTSLDPFHGTSMVVNNPNATAFHEFTPGENLVLASNSDMGQSMEVRAGFLELNDSGQVTGSGFGVLVNQDGELLVDGSGDFFPQGWVSVGDTAGVTNAIAQFTGSGTVIIGNPVETVGLYVGNLGKGNVSQTGSANVTTPSLIIGNESGSSGLYQLDTTGTLDVTGDEVVALDGSGDFLQIAGTNKIVGSLILGEQFGTGTFELEGGSVTAAAVDVHADSFSTGFTALTQSGGTLTASSVTVDQATAFNLSNGTCSAAVVSAGVFNFSGGLVIGNITNTGRMTYTGGSLIGSFTNDGVTNLDASFTVPFSMLNETPLAISSGIVLTVNLSGIDNESTIVLEGGTLAGNGTKTNDYAITGEGTISGSGALINNGSLVESGGSIVLSMAGNPYTNNGTIVLQTNTGELDLNTPNSPTSDRLINNGTVNMDGSVVDGAGGFENASGGLIVGPGKFNNVYFVNDAGGTISVPAGTLNIVPSFSSAGAIELSDPAANLTGGAITNTGTIEGIGTVASGISNSGTIQVGSGTLTLSGSVTNLSAGTISVPSGGTVLVTSGLPSNLGTIELSGGTFDNNGNTIVNTGLITGFGIFNAGTLGNGHFGSGTMALGGGDSIINAEVNNAHNLTVTDGTALFTGDVNNGGAFMQATNATVTIDGNLVSYSYVSSNSTNIFQGNVIISGASIGSIMSGGDSDVFELNGANFTINNNGAFSNTGTLESQSTTVNNGTFTQTGLLVQAADFTNNATATIGGSQIWAAGTNFNNTAGVATFQSDAGATASTLTVNVTGGLVALASPQHWAGLTISGGQVDVANNHIIIAYGDGPDPIATIAGYLQSGYNGGAWNGLGIESSVAAAEAGYALGYADGADGVVAGLTPGEIEIAFTLYGDANLDGVVNGDDFTILASNIGKTVTGWDQGDFNYDGLVSGDDFTLLVSNLGKQANGANVQLPASDYTAILAFAAAHDLMADVPEPTSAGLAMLAGMGVLSARRRSTSRR